MRRTRRRLPEATSSFVTVIDVENVLADWADQHSYTALSGLRRVADSAMMEE